MAETSTIELSRTALLHNLSFIHDVIGPGTEFVAVVKGNAYGHGIETFVPLAFECGIRSFAVFSSNEARTLLESGVKPDRLMIMGNIEPSDLIWVIENELDFFCFNIDRLQKAIELAKVIEKKIHIHLEIETGMNRTGFRLHQVQNLISILKQERKYLVIEGICTHLAGAEEISNYLRIREQIKRFNQIRKIFDQNNVKYLKTHAACSAATINYPKTIFDLVRIGIMQYGFWPSREVKMAYLTKQGIHNDPLKRVITWRTKIMDIVEVNAGEYIGYGRSYLAESEMKIAIIPVGYAHGYSRTLSNLGKAIVNNARISSVGTINMNMAAFDVTHVKDIKIGDTAILIGQSDEIEISVASFSDMSNQLNYELLTRLPQSIPRIITK